MKVKHNKLRTSYKVGLLVLLMTLANTACKKDRQLTSGGEIHFSVDTLTFDTVFTSYATFTCSLAVFNPQNQKINISSIRLANPNSFFHLNINGISGNSISNVEVAANDSFYIFATVNINPKDSNNPYIIQDRLIATLNGKEFSIPLIAFGQDAHYIVGEYLQTQTFKTDRPYVILQSAVVNEDQVVTIPAGCKIYMNADSRLVVKGTLKVEGTKDKPIIFQGDRLDRGYFGDEGYPGEWGGIYFDVYSHDNEINYAVLKNCGNSALGALPGAIQLAPDLLLDNKKQLTLTNTIIENSIGYGIVSFQGSLKAENCLVHTCGAQALAILQGGSYEIDNCTFALYSSVSKQGATKVEHQEEPAVAILNYFENKATNQVFADSLNATLRNCIIWGSLEDELYTSKVDNFKYNVTLDHCIVKTKQIASIVNSVSNKINQDPSFADQVNGDYKVKAGSPAIDAGVPAVSTDIEGKVRPQGGATDIGCYEF